MLQPPVLGALVKQAHEIIKMHSYVEDMIWNMDPETK
jgi:hypothetical protein